MDRSNATYSFLGSEPLWAAAYLELYDIHGLWGGRRIHVAGSGQVVMQLVQPGMIERRYQFKLDAAEWKQLLVFLVENDFLTVQPIGRLGVPDEARPSITLVNAKGEQLVVAKWAGVNEPRFDAIYSALRRLETFTTQLKPVYSGPYQHGGINPKSESREMGHSFD
jgi:hypothetical protein